ncbi:diacylglycerol kinase family protein [Hoeflea sp.]|uniref:diacylglycerol/lipid kinase family protein n=1 Tax=Hoeflea sp. TaxID=1940281 RepID=UPI0019A3B370|nr:diacylglycerol kinase family protein [Hoeflea sp.]MBC7284583.1 diacylglycerol kinase family lipid kinase [Hoeflea sp.]
MRTVLILNQDGGTIRGMDAREFGEMACEKLAGLGDGCEVRLVSGKDLVETLDEAADDTDIGTIVAGGGDGTISAAATACFHSGKTLGVIPLGTMNLFARGLGLPLDPPAAIEALASATVMPLDIATANGRPFVHQFSAGMHARMVRQRDRLDTSTRMRKIASTIKTLGRVILHPPKFRVEIDTGSGRESHIVSAIAVSNNLFGDTPLSYAPVLDAGVLGVYQSHALGSGEVFRMTLHAALGRLQEDPGMTVGTAQKVTLSFPDHHVGTRAAIDGEIVPLDTEVELVCHAGALKVLVPDTYAGAPEA